MYAVLNASLSSLHLFQTVGTRCDRQEEPPSLAWRELARNNFAGVVDHVLDGFKGSNKTHVFIAGNNRDMLSAGIK